MKRTKYFTHADALFALVWRVRDNTFLEYFSAVLNTWVVSVYSFDGKTIKEKGGDIKYYQITRDQARRLQSKAFRSKA